jgi:4-alpha-glucanotransferase
VTGLHAVAAAAGLVVDWEDAQGRPQTVCDDALTTILEALGYACATEADRRLSLEQIKAAVSPLIVVTAGDACVAPLPAGPAQLVLEDGTSRDVRLSHGPTGVIFVADAPIGYHRLEAAGAAIEIAICPPQALSVHDLLGRRAWGATAQVYSLRDETPRGFGDFGAVRDLAKVLGDAGADALAISPVHSLFLARPDRYSPYSPSSRDHLNPLFADLEAIVAGASNDLIDWPSASAAKVAALRRAYRRFEGDPAFDAFVTEGGEDLRRHAVFEALDERYKAQTGASDWRAWPKPFQRANGDAVAAWTVQNADAVRFHLFCQWRADRDLATAQSAALSAGMGLGLITDLAVGLDPGGSHAWSRPEDLLSGLTIGAPPDAFQAAGQGWGITSFAPDALRRSGFAPFLQTIRAALRHAGGLRIDHALGLNRLWVLPEGARPLEGAYLRNPFNEMLSLAALESWRSRAVLIGEDLGIVPEGLRAKLEARGLAGMRVLPFERDSQGRFTAPGAWDVRAAAMTTTHDLAPIAGWWRGCDIAWRERLGAIGDRAVERAERSLDRTDLWRAAVSAGAATGPAPAPEHPKAAVDAAVGMAAMSACELALIPMEDLLGLDQAVNLPGVVDVHPNWRRRLPSVAQALSADDGLQGRIAVLKAERPQ